MLEFELLRIALAVVGTGLAAVQDGFTSFIDDRITLSMIGAGLLLNLYALYQGQTGFFVSFFIVFALIGVLGYFAYRTGEFGGGDVLLFLGLHALLPIQPQMFLQVEQVLPDFLPLIANVFFAASLLGVVGSAVLYAWKFYSLKIKISKTEFLALAICFSLLGLILTFSSLNPKFKWFVFLLGMPAFFLLVFRKKIMDEVIIRPLKISEIQDEDILAVNKMDKQVVKKYGLERVVTKPILEKLKLLEKKERVHEFPIHTNLPRFAPYIFLALVATILFGNLLVLLLF